MQHLDAFFEKIFLLHCFFFTLPKKEKKIKAKRKASPVHFNFPCSLLQKV